MQPISQMSHIALSNSLPLNMVQVNANNSGDLVDDPLYFLACGEGRIRNFENIDHTIREDNLIDFKVDIFVHQSLNTPNISLDAHILEDVDCNVDDFWLFDVHYGC